MNAIATRPQVADMVRLRNEALTMFSDAHDQLTRTSELLDKARRLGLLAAPGTSGFLMASREEEENVLSKLKVPERDVFMRDVTRVLDRNIWGRIIELTDLQRLMDKEAKDKLRAQMLADPAEVTEENVYATLETFVASAGEIFVRGIANVFSKLDRRFRSHDGFKIGSRIIVDRAFDDTGYWNHYSHHRDTLMDIERTFCVLDEREVPVGYAGIVGEINLARERGGFGAKQTELESDFFRIRIFKNGNCHLWFKRDDLVTKVNKLLASYYGEVLGDATDEGDDLRANQKTTPAKNFGFFPTPEEAAKKVIEYAKLDRRAGDEPLTVLEPSAGTGNLARLCVEAGAIVDCIEIQPGLADALRAGGGYRSVVCADFLSVPAEQRWDRLVLNPPFDRERDIDHVVHALDFLKEDGRLVAIMSAGVEYRETRKAIAFRELVSKLNGHFVDLPQGSFASVGTNVNTTILVLNKNGRKDYWWR